MNYNIKILKAVGDETRLNIILNLMNKEMSVLQIVSAVKKSQPNVSIALRKLLDAGLVSSRRDMKQVFYKINKKDFMIKLLDLIKNEI
jgi:ArsR family transcriptional regulator